MKSIIFFKSACASSTSINALTGITSAAPATIPVVKLLLPLACKSAPFDCKPALKLSNFFTSACFLLKASNSERASPIDLAYWSTFFLLASNSERAALNTFFCLSTCLLRLFTTFSCVFIASDSPLFDLPLSSYAFFIACNFLLASTMSLFKIKYALCCLFIFSSIALFAAKAFSCAFIFFISSCIFFISSDVFLKLPTTDASNLLAIRNASSIFLAIVFLLPSEKLFIYLFTYSSLCFSSSILISSIRGTQ